MEACGMGFIPTTSINAHNVLDFIKISYTQAIFSPFLSSPHFLISYVPLEFPPPL